MKGYVVELVIGILLFGIGCGYIGFEVLDFKFIDSLPENTFKYTEKETTYDVDTTKMYNIYNKYGKVHINIDDTMENEIVIKTSYADKYLDLDVYDNCTVTTNNNCNIKFDYDVEMNNSDVKDFLEILKSDVKNRKIHDYVELFRPNVEVYVSNANVSYINGIDGKYSDVDFYEEDFNFKDDDDFWNK